MEVFFSILMVSLFFVTIKNKYFLPIFFIALIGSNPYVTAGSLLLTLITRFKTVFKSDVNRSLFIFCSLWLCYSFIVGTVKYNTAFVSEFIQLTLSIMLLFYIYNSINNKEEFYKNIKYLMYSGILLCLIKVVIDVFELNISTSAFIDYKTNNYASFYILITTVVTPLLIIKKKLYCILTILLGVYVISINDSRANLIIALLLIAKEFISFKSYFLKFIVICLFSYVFYYFYNAFDSSSLFDNTSLYSVLNFENNFSNLERLNLIMYSFDLFNLNLLGNGLGSSFDLFFNNKVTVNNHYPHPHNTLAFLAVELGVVGILIYLLFFYNIIKSYKKIIDIDVKRFILNITISLFIFSFVDVLFYNGILMLFTFILLGLSSVASKLSFK